MRALPFWEEKCWGEVLHCFHNPQASVSYLKVQAGYRCSRHYHWDRANDFIVISGQIMIETWGLGSLVGEHTTTSPKTELLVPGDTHSIPSKLLHRFNVIESGEVIEVYWADHGGVVSIDDIVRIDVGGKIP